MIALCNKHTDCVFAVFTRPERITVEMAEDMLRVRNLFPAIQADEDPEGAEKAMALLRKRKLPFGVAYRCTGDNAEQAATEEQRDDAHLLSGGALPPSIDRPLLQFACQMLNEFTLSETQRVRLRDGFHEGIRAVLLKHR